MSGTLVAIVALLAVISKKKPESPSSHQTSQATTPSAEIAAPAPVPPVLALLPPASELRSSDTASHGGGIQSHQAPSILPEHAIPPDANPNVAAVVQAARDGTHPERRSALAMPEPFSEADFAQNPQKYLDITEPGRVWQTKAPGPNVPALSAVSSIMIQMPPLGTTVLKVSAVPFAPVSFYSADKGAFSNQLTSITVRADATGLAEAAFTATRGTTATVSLLAASPMTSGQIQFLVDVQPDG